MKIRTFDHDMRKNYYAFHLHIAALGATSKVLKPVLVYSYCSSLLLSICFPCIFETYAFGFLLDIILKQDLLTGSNLLKQNVTQIIFSLNYL